MRIALVGPELEENLALRYLDAALAAAGHQPQIFDFHAAAQIELLAAEIAGHQPQVVGLSMVFTARAAEFIQLARRLRSIGYAGQITAGGHFATFHAQQLLEGDSPFDTIIHGEAEEPLVELVGNLDSPDRVPGVSWRRADGQIEFTGRRDVPEDLDERPWPTRPDTFHEYLGLPIANMLAGRGCFANCSFCSINAWHRQLGGRRFRQRSAACVADEMARLYHDRGVRIFNFHDDNFFLPTKAANLQRFGELQQQLQRHSVGQVGIQVKVRPDSVDAEVMALLKQIGLFRVFLGVETNAVAGLKTLNRGIERQQNDNALAILKRFEIHTCFNLLMFDPYSRLEDVRENVAFMRRQAGWPLNFCRVEIYAGTQLEQQLRSEGRLEGNFLGYGYRILEPQVQLAYEIFRDVFTPRNFETEGLNHQAMKIDYYLHILRHFWPRQSARSLIREVKHLVAELNRNSASLLTDICRFVDADPLPRQSQVEATSCRLEAARAEFDQQMAPRMESVLAQIRQAATVTTAPRRSEGRWVRAASVAAAALIAATGACTDAQDTHMHERAPAPLEPGGQPPVIPLDTHPCEMAPREIPEIDPETLRHPTPDLLKRDFSKEEEDAIFKRVVEQYWPVVENLTKKHLPQAEQQGLPDAELFIGSNGQVHLAILRWPDDRHKNFQNELTQAMTDWKFPAIKKAGHGTLPLDLRKALKRIIKVPENLNPPDFHMFEMVPAPLDDPPGQ